MYLGSLMRNGCFFFKVKAASTFKKCMSLAYGITGFRWMLCREDLYACTEGKKHSREKHGKEWKTRDRAGRSSVSPAWDRDHVRDGKKERKAKWEHFWPKYWLERGMMMEQRHLTLFNSFCLEKRIAADAWHCLILNCLLIQLIRGDNNNHKLHFFCQNSQVLSNSYSSLAVIWGELVMEKKNDHTVLRLL